MAYTNFPHGSEGSETALFFQRFFPIPEKDWVFWLSCGYILILRKSIGAGFVLVVVLVVIYPGRSRGQVWRIFFSSASLLFVLLLPLPSLLWLLLLLLSLLVSFVFAARLDFVWKWRRLYRGRD